MPDIGDTTSDMGGPLADTGGPMTDIGDPLVEIGLFLPGTGGPPVRGCTTRGDAGYASPYPEGGVIIPSNIFHRIAS